MTNQRSKSLRFRLVLGTSISAFIIFTLLGLVIYFSMKRSMTTQFDDALRLKAKAIAGVVEQKEGRIVIEFDPQQLTEYTQKKSSDFFEIVAADGSMLAISESMGGSHLAKLNGNLPSGHIVDCVLPGGKKGRVLRQEFKPYIEADEMPSYSDGKYKVATANIYIASRTKALNETLEDLSWLLMSLGAVAIVVIGATLAWVVTRMLRPVQDLANRIDGLREDNLSVPINIPSVPTELKPVVDQLNQMMHRLHTAFDRERSFTADVAHELRTPLAGLRSMLQVTRTRQRSTTEYESMIDKCLSVNSGMQAMVETLLDLARVDTGQWLVRKEMVDISMLIETQWNAVASDADVKQLRVESIIPSALAVDSDVEKLRIIIRNILDNSVSHTPTGGSIRIELKKENRIVLEVSNQPVEIKPEEIQHVFERFWQGDVARTSIGRHSGLGLPLCQNLCRILNAELSATVNAGVFVVRLEL